MSHSLRTNWLGWVTLTVPIPVGVTFGLSSHELCLELPGVSPWSMSFSSMEMQFTDPVSGDVTTRFPMGSFYAFSSPEQAAGSESDTISAQGGVWCIIPQSGAVYYEGDVFKVRMSNVGAGATSLPEGTFARVTAYDTQSADHWPDEDGNYFDLAELHPFAAPAAFKVLFSGAIATSPLPAPYPLAGLLRGEPKAAETPFGSSEDRPLELAAPADDAALAELLALL